MISLLMNMHHCILEHHFNGRLFSRIPYLRKLNLRGNYRELKEFMAEFRRKNKMLNASELTYIAPEISVEYHAGVGNIFKQCS